MFRPPSIEEPSAASPRIRRGWWSNRRVRGYLYQALVLGGVLLLAAFLVDNTLANLERRSIATGFGFLEREAGFGIGESLIAYSPADTFLRALTVGLLNTLKVSLLGIVLATLVGTLAGIARLSHNWLLARIAGLYVEGLRNIPVLLQLFFWYALITEGLPLPREALNPLPGVFLSARGLRFPVPVWETTHLAMVVAFLGGCLGAWLLGRWARRRQELTGLGFPVLRIGVALILVPPLAAYLLGGAPIALSMPELRGFNFSGGSALSPELAALLIGLVLYTGTYIAEIVRGGILSVSHGQTEAGLALGLRRAQVLRLVVLPQALRVIIPPLTSQYLNLTKNSSLAVAIGYPDLVSVVNTSINQTGQAVEGVAILMGVYLTISLSISLFMGWYNRRVAIQGQR